jgi:integrase
VARPKREVPWLGKRSGRFYAFWYDAEQGETKRLSLRTGDGGEAKDRFAQFLVEGVLAKPRVAAGLTVSQALDDYYREHAAKMCADPRRQEDAIVHLKAFFGDLPLAEVDIPRSRNYADARRVGMVGGGTRRQGDLRKGSDSTIRRELVVLHAASKHAKRWKRAAAPVTVELPAERRLGEDDEAPYFTRAELDMLLSTADGELYHFINLAYFTGARRRSIQEMTVPQIRWGQRQIVLKAEAKRSTKKRQPIVPILPEMLPSLETLAGGRKEGRLFKTADFYQPFRGLCESLGLGDRSHPHLLRHTRATHLLQAGVPIYDVAKLLGDALATVDRVYGHHSSERLFESLRGK